ncbi:MAG: FHA domain-containing protein [Nanoarchaeota archaeon]|nr:FHA domain-containing protein [Nanoarchaeota archaeon]
MIQAYLTDTNAKRTYDLSRLLLSKSNDIITIGRQNQRNDIVLGKDDFDELISNKELLKELISVSRMHASLEYKFQTYTPDCSGFFMRDAHSTFGTKILRGKGLISISQNEGITLANVPVPIILDKNKILLQNEDQIFFAQYGPVIYKEAQI